MVSDLDIEEINKSIVAFFNEDADLSKILAGDEIRNNSMMIEIIGNMRASGFVIRGSKAEIIRGKMEKPTVKFTIARREDYYLMIEDILSGVDVRNLIATMVFSYYPKMVMDPPVEHSGVYHLEGLLQILSQWQEKMLGTKK